MIKRIAIDQDQRSKLESQSASTSKPVPRRSSLIEYDVVGENGEPQSLAMLEGKVVLVVNVACLCGFTGQYVQLQELQDRYGPQGFTVVAFPCNQFGKQEPWDRETIEKFAKEKFQVTFPIFEKVNVNGKAAEPFFEFLKRSLPGMFGSKGIKWNFTKFLCGRDGVPYKRYSSLYSPRKIGSDIEKLLKMEHSAPTPRDAIATEAEATADDITEAHAEQAGVACPLPRQAHGQTSRPVVSGPHGRRASPASKIHAPPEGSPRIIKATLV